MLITCGSIDKEVTRPIIEDMILMLVRGEELAKEGNYVESIRELGSLCYEIQQLMHRYDAKNRGL